MVMPPVQLFSLVPADVLGTDSGEGCWSMSSGDCCVVVVAAGARTKGKGEPGAPSKTRSSDTDDQWTG